MKLLSLAVAVAAVCTAGAFTASGTSATGAFAETATFPVASEAPEPLLKCDRRTDEPHVKTKAFMDALHEDMYRVVAAQDSYRALYGRFARTVTDLNADIVTPGLEIALVTADDGWHATAGGSLLTVSCAIFAGTIEPPSAALTARDPNCAPLPQFAY